MPHLHDDPPGEPPEPQEGDPGPGHDDMTEDGYAGGPSTFEREPQDEVTWSRDAGGRWALYGPAGLLREGGTVEVHRKDGSTSAETVGPPADPGGAPLPEGMAMHSNVEGGGQRSDGDFRREPRDEVVWSRTSDGRWALYGPAGLLREGGTAEVHRKDGSSSTEAVGPAVDTDADLPEGMAMHAVVRRGR